jgi:hypothetical protein
MRTGVFEEWGYTRDWVYMKIRLYNIRIRVVRGQGLNEDWVI